MNSPKFDPYRGQCVLVTGASGFIGRWVARALSEAGAELCLTTRAPQELQRVCEDCGIRGRFEVVDLSEPAAGTRVCEEVRPSVVFNLAGYGVGRDEGDPKLAQALNTRLVAELVSYAGNLQSSDWRGLRLIHTGSAFEYGEVRSKLTENLTCVPTTLYGRTKLAGTQQLLAGSARTGGRAVVARLFTVYGPGERPSRLLPSLLRLAGTGESVPLTAGEQKRDFTYVGDVAEGLLRLGLLPRVPGILNLATGKLTTVREFAETAAQIAGLREEQVRFGALPTRPEEPHQGDADTSLLEENLSWRPSSSIEEGIRKTLAFETTRKMQAGMSEPQR